MQWSALGDWSRLTVRHTRPRALRGSPSPKEALRRWVPQHTAAGTVATHSGWRCAAFAARGVSGGAERAALAGVGADCGRGWGFAVDFDDCCSALVEGCDALAGEDRLGGRIRSGVGRDVFLRRPERQRLLILHNPIDRLRV